jgi:hypothetical protein
MRRSAKIWRDSSFLITKRFMGMCSMKAAWACSTRSFLITLLHACGVLQRAAQPVGALSRVMQNVSDADAAAVYAWLKRKGLQMKLGTDEATELTEPQVLLQCKMYIAAVRLADEFGCDAIGIQYQQGLKDLTPASDLVEGMLNNTDRPPVKSARIASACCLKACRCCISTRSTNAPVWTACVTYRVRKAWL